LVDQSGLKLDLWLIDRIERMNIACPKEELLDLKRKRRAAVSALLRRTVDRNLNGRPA
jgi:hypothetical protein